MKRTILLILCAAGLFAGGYFLGKMQDAGEDGMDVTYRVVIDTVRHTMPVSKQDTTIRYDIVRLARADDGSGGNVADEPDKADKCRSEEDSVSVRVPITQRVYGDSSHTAWVSGFRARLDSIEIYPRTEIMTVSTKAKRREQRWGIGIQAGYGVTVGKSPQFTPYIGVGVSYNLIKF